MGQWLDIWQRDYLGAVKPSTVRNYRDLIRLHIKPALGAVKLTDLHPHTAQNFINGIDRAPATVRLICGVLSEALEKAVELDYIPQNPVKRCTLPRKKQKEIHPLTDDEVAALLEAARDTDIEHLLTVALFTGMCMSELLGLTWDCVSFDKGTITVNKQLALPAHRKTGEVFNTSKNHKSRNVAAAPSVLVALRAQHRRQAEMQLRAGSLWDNAYDLVFTNAAGSPMPQRSVESLRDFCHAKPCPEGKKYCVILDNAPWYKKAIRLIWKEQLKEYADIREKMECLPLPPYSTDLSPIEQVWRKTRRKKHITDISINFSI